MVKLDSQLHRVLALLGLCEFRPKQYEAAFPASEKKLTCWYPLAARGPLLDIAITIWRSAEPAGAFQVRRKF